MSRESLARATNSGNLEMESGVTHDVDRLAAAAGGNTLGGLLLRLREGAQARWAKRVVLILTNRIQDKQKLGRDIAEKVAMAALLEFISPHCVVCKGARQITLEQEPGEAKGKGRVPTVTCHACDGTGQQRFTNAMRREHIGTYSNRIGEAMTATHDHMATSLGAYLAHADERLE